MIWNAKAWITAYFAVAVLYPERSLQVKNRNDRLSHQHYRNYSAYFWMPMCWYKTQYYSKGRDPLASVTELLQTWLLIITVIGSSSVVDLVCCPTFSFCPSVWCVLYSWSDSSVVLSLMSHNLALWKTVSGALITSPTSLVYIWAHCILQVSAPVYSTGIELFPPFT